MTLRTWCVERRGDALPLVAKARAGHFQNRARTAASFVNLVSSATILRQALAAVDGRGRDRLQSGRDSIFTVDIDQSIELVLM